MTKTRKRRTTPFDERVGVRLREARLAAKMSQGDLASAMGDVTYQQVQKYEKGVNRMSAGRLQSAAEALSVSVNHFFD